MSYSINTIVDYFGNSELCLGVVVKDQQERVQVRGVTNQVAKIALKQILADYGLCTANNPLPTLIGIQNEISAIQQEIEIDFLWEELLANSSITDIHDIAAEYFGKDYSKQQLSAIARALTADTIHFQHNGNDFVARSPEEAEKLLELRRQRAEKAAAKERVKQWLSSVIQRDEAACIETPVEVTPDAEGFIAQCSDYLFKGLNCDAVNILAAASSRMTPRELALSVLKKSGRLPKGTDEFLVINGIHSGFTDTVLEHAASLQSYAPDGSRRDLTGLRVFSIDDESTREIDDALSIERNGDGSFTVGIHLANPSSFVMKGDPLDQVAVERPLSLYLPTQTVTMFPERLSCDLASLNAGEIRPAMSFLVTFTPEGEYDDWEVCQSQVKVQHRLTYIQADEMLEKGDESDPLVGDLMDLAMLSRHRFFARNECGAVTFNRPEVRVRVKDDVITATVENQNTPSHNLVQEFMVLANHLAGLYALRNDIPVIYRCQDAPLYDVYSVINYDPVEFDIQVRKMKRTRLSTYPQPHFGLGLDLYTQISSPLRRYADMVIQRQICAHLSGKTPEYTQQELFGIVDNVESTSSTNRALDRDARKFWLLEYLRRNCIGKVMEGIVVRQEGSLILVEIDDYCERGVLLTRERMVVGENLKVRIVNVNPKAGRLEMEPAW